MMIVVKVAGGIFSAPKMKLASPARKIGAQESMLMKNKAPKIPKRFLTLTV
jgi:hypothetical protein